MKGSNVFTVMVVGDNPHELMEKYNSNIEVEPYVKYKYKDADKIKNNSIKLFESIIEDPRKFDLNDYAVDMLKEKLSKMKNLSTFEYYKSLVEGYFIDDNGNALSTENPNGKWQTYKLGNNFSLPLKLLNGGETRESINSEIDWDSMHMNNTSVYESVWQMVVEGREPKNEHEQTLYDNMSVHTNYFKKFNNVDEYVIHNCAYWNYAYLDKNGWVDMDDAKNMFLWISTYFDKFVSKLQPTDKVTIFECTNGKVE